MLALRQLVLIVAIALVTVQSQAIAHAADHHALDAQGHCELCLHAERLSAGPPTATAAALAPARWTSPRVQTIAHAVASPLRGSHAIRAPPDHPFAPA